MPKLLLLLPFVLFFTGCEHVAVKSQVAASYPREAFVQMQQVIDENQALLEFSHMAIEDDSEAMAELEERYNSARTSHNAFVEGLIEVTEGAGDTPSAQELQQSYAVALEAFRDFRKYAHDIAGVPLESKRFSLIPEIDSLLAYIERVRHEEPNATSQQALETLQTLRWPPYSEL